MRIVAIYLTEHDLFEGAQTINLGGEYLYDISDNGKSAYISRKQNPEYIEGFFIETESKSKLELISAIVGQNGSGKSSILNVIRSKFKKNSYGFLKSKTIIIVEDEENSLPLLLQSDFYDVKYKFNFEELKLRNDFKNLDIELNSISTDKFQAIYYSPHYDYTYNPNFDELDKYDISFDKILEKDLSELDKKNTNQSGWDFKPSEELIFKNSLRQILFLNSDAVKNNLYFKDFFGLPEHGTACLVFRGYKKEDEWNTPSSFRPILKLIKEKVSNEINDWIKIRKFDKKHRVKNQLEINKHLLKRYSIQDFISVVESQMEKYNDYLSEGKIDYKNIIKEIQENNFDAYKSLLLFIKSSKITKYSYTFNVFNTEVVTNLFNLIYEEIDNGKNEEDVTLTRILFATPENTIKILKLQREFLNKLFEYYPKLVENEKTDAVLKEGSKIDGFINYLPTEKKLSSGENALLNLFSRVYDFIYSNISINNFLPSSENYILLLDEADLAFHPQWKKQYVLSLLNTIPYLFEEIKTKPSIQIIFTTHDSLTLSDIPNNNVVYISKGNDKSIILLKEKKPNKSFGANIHELLSNSFFLKTGHIGDFSKKKINWVIHLLSQIISTKNDSSKKTIEVSDKSKQNIKRIITMTGDNIIRAKLLDMYYTAFRDDENLNKEIENLEKRLNELRKKRKDD
ncbi:OLD family protein [Tenacibaculum maritimum]|uniref:hypothetical protein n=1 Tax=Tenacibaculum maritimum TaxID=107401 RepID=UPI0012E545BF|nr:hypothetical protein [Tenacibaculum maritimum]CAA0205413.1 conserved hypothetical protein [Tenacibaculum maritimum]